MYCLVQFMELAEFYFLNCCRWNLSLGVYAAEVTLDTSALHTDMRIHGE